MWGGKNRHDILWWLIFPISCFVCSTYKLPIYTVYTRFHFLINIGEASASRIDLDVGWQTHECWQSATVCVWQEKRTHITDLYQGMMLSLAHIDVRIKARTWPTCMHNTRILTRTGKKPQEVSLRERGVALPRAHFSQADPREREWIEEMWGQGHALEVELSVRETRAANVSWASNARQTKASFKVSQTLQGAAKSNGSVKSSWRGFTDYFSLVSCSKQGFALGKSGKLSFKKSDMNVSWPGWYPLKVMSKYYKGVLIIGSTLMVVHWFIQWFSIDFFL